jgi:hypothetical protein
MRLRAQCAAGYGTFADGIPGECSLCAVGTFWVGPSASGKALAPGARGPLLGVQPCLACNDSNAEGNFTTLGEGSKSVADCVCQPGHG